MSEQPIHYPAGTKVRIVAPGSHRAGGPKTSITIEGEVTGCCRNWGTEEAPNWNIEFVSRSRDMWRSHGAPPDSPIYGYWKQGSDGGTVEFPDAEWDRLEDESVAAGEADVAAGRVLTTEEVFGE